MSDGMLHDRGADAVVTAAWQPGRAGSDLRDVIQAVREVVDLIRHTSVTRLQLSVGDMSLDIECAAAPATDRIVGASVPAEPLRPAAQPDRMRLVAPIMGVFHRRPGPGQPPFVEVGQRVEAGQQVAIVEAMKVMNPVVADLAGVVRQVHVDDGEVVEFEQLLMSLEP
ncbi:MAG: acetyl-CoA carboxylase biotin carboxyl carrier protein [Egibacteraceae bacterium]